MGSVNRVYIARLSRMLVLGPLGESVGRVRDVVISISIVRQQPRVLGLVVDLAPRRSARSTIYPISSSRCSR
ncbi:hypothetical protein A5738_10225 [Mycobacterium colombiense]|nr:hypothetical protein A5738_10225 [Mycobacterium colombiense]